MNLEKYERDTQRLLVEAQRETKARQHQAIEPEHVLWAMVQNAEAVSALKKLDVNVGTLKSHLELSLQKLPTVRGGATFLSPRLLKVAAQAEVSITRQGDEKVLARHLLAAMIDLGAEVGPSKRLLSEAGLTKNKMKSLVTGKAASVTLKSQKKKGQEEEENVLQAFAANLTEKAQLGELDRVIGRDDELRRIIQVLARRRKNNPVLIGKPGVGKNAIIQALATRIARGDVPSTLINKQLLSLDMGSLVAGASLRGQFEARMKKLIDELKAAQGEVILFIDEIHTMVGAGGDGASDASNMLKPALARGEIQVLGATTPDEYRNSIEKDKALERRFQSILVEEPDHDETLQILRGIKDRFEVFHGVQVEDQALSAAIKFSTRYISGRSLPDKAIDLIDEASSRLRIEIDSVPVELDQAKRELLNVRTELKAIEDETSDEAVKTRERLEKRETELSAESDVLQSRWQKEVQLLQTIRGLKESIRDQENELQAAEQREDIDEASELKFGTLKKLREELAEKEQELENETGGQRLLKEAVTEGDIAEVVAAVTGVPVQSMMESERDKLLQMESRIGRKVIGQREGIAAIAKAIRRSRAGLNDPNRPVGSFFFLGPTGVGKTYLAKQVTKFLFEDEKSMVRLDMSEFMEKQSVIRLIGAPPGYRDSEAGGQLTEAVRLKPYSVILFDEVEKAHPDVFNILLQVLDDGRLSDSKGNLVSFKNTVIIMTSNVGSNFLLEASLDDGVIEDEAKEQAMAAMRGHFRPEFLGRIDEIVMFHGLTRSNIEDIAELHFKDLSRLLEGQKLTMSFDDEAKKFVIDAGYEPAYGARPLRRAIQKMLQDPMSMALLDGRFNPGDNIRITLKKTKGSAPTLDFIPESP